MGIFRNQLSVLSYTQGRKVETEKTILLLVKVTLGILLAGFIGHTIKTAYSREKDMNANWLLFLLALEAIATPAYGLFLTV